MKYELCSFIILLLSHYYGVLRESPQTLEINHHIKARHQQTHRLYTSILFSN